MEEICNQEGCSSKVYANGKCHYHRMVERFGSYSVYQKARIAKKPICTVEHCKNNQYAKGLCTTHYNAKISGKVVDVAKYRHKTCKFENCKKSGRYDGLCLTHKKIFERTGRLSGTRKGEYNHFWRGGVSEYKNHSLFKRNGKYVMDKNNHVCSSCGGAAKVVHHLDGTKTNHEIENLVPLCHSCHAKMHKKKTSKFKRSHGLTLELIAELRGVKASTILNWIKNGVFEQKMSTI
jgi:hypothetical protein